MYTPTSDVWVDVFGLTPVSDLSHPWASQGHAQETRTLMYQYHPRLSCHGISFPFWLEPHTDVQHLWEVEGGTRLVSSCTSIQSMMLGS